MNRRQICHGRDFDCCYFNLFLETIDQYKEVSDLERGLNTEFDFRPDEGLPLMVIKEQLEKNLVSMRELYNEKRSMIENLLNEQEPLVGELGENTRDLPLDPLASESEIKDFKLYLCGLKEERIHRLEEINRLQKDIKAICIETELNINESFLET